MPASPDADDRLGRTLHERYRVVERVAAGTMGVVYRGERVGLGRAVAIKFLQYGAAPEHDLRRRFTVEAQAAARMCHPNCVGVIDFGVDAGTPFLVMDYIGGGTLRDVLKAGPLDVPHALEIARQILAGLAHAHAHGIVHRDIKPDNILVWRDAMGEHVQITDFGLAKLDAPTLAISQDVAIGTPTYMSPEATMGWPVDARSDVYSAGVVLFEMLALQKPFIGRSPFETMELHRDAPVPAFADVAPERWVSPAIEAVVQRALAKLRDDRYASAVDLAFALERAVAGDREATDALDVGELLSAASTSRRWLAPFALAAVIGASAYLWTALHSISW